MPVNLVCPIKQLIGDTRGAPSRALDTAFSPRFRIVQPYGRDVGRESTTISENATVAEAFAEIDRLAEQMVRTGARPETVTLLVVDARGSVVARRGTH